MKNLLTQWELRRRIDDYWERNTEEKIINKKPPDPGGVLKGKPTPKLEPWGLLLLGFFAKAVKWPAVLLCAAKPSHQRSNHCESGSLELESLRASHCRCDINKRHEDCFGGKKNNRLIIGKKPPNSAGTEEENRGKKVFLLVQSFRINLLSQ